MDFQRFRETVRFPMLPKGLGQRHRIPSVTRCKKHKVLQWFLVDLRMDLCRSAGGLREGLFPASKADCRSLCFLQCFLRVFGNRKIRVLSWQVR